MRLGFVGYQHLDADVEQQHATDDLLNSMTAKNVRTTRRTIAPKRPNSMACFCCLGGRARLAMAMTTALSPLSMMLIIMIWPSVTQKNDVPSISIPTPPATAA
jgi:hypothetical protein